MDIPRQKENIMLLHNPVHASKSTPIATHKWKDIACVRIEERKAHTCTCRYHPSCVGTYRYRNPSCETRWDSPIQLQTYGFRCHSNFFSRPLLLPGRPSLTFIPWGRSSSALLDQAGNVVWERSITAHEGGHRSVRFATGLLGLLLLKTQRLEKVRKG